MVLFVNSNFPCYCLVDLPLGLDWFLDFGQGRFSCKNYQWQAKRYIVQTTESGLSWGEAALKACVCFSLFLPFTLAALAALLYVQTTSRFFCTCELGTQTEQKVQEEVVFIEELEPEKNSHKILLETSTALTPQSLQAFLECTQQKKFPRECDGFATSQIAPLFCTCEFGTQTEQKMQEEVVFIEELELEKNSHKILLETSTALTPQSLQAFLECTQQKKFPWECDGFATSRIAPQLSYNMKDSDIAAFIEKIDQLAARWSECQTSCTLEALVEVLAQCEELCQQKKTMEQRLWNGLSLDSLSKIENFSFEKKNPFSLQLSCDSQSVVFSLARPQPFQEALERLCQIEREASSLAPQQIAKEYTLEDCGAGGNCLFLSLATVFGCKKATKEEAFTLRKEIVQYIEQNKDTFLPLIEEWLREEKTCEPKEKNPEYYFQTMREQGTWGGKAEILAAAQCKNRCIYVVHQQPQKHEVVLHRFHESARDKGIVVIFCEQDVHFKAYRKR